MVRIVCRPLQRYPELDEWRPEPMKPQLPENPEQDPSPRDPEPTLSESLAPLAPLVPQEETRQETEEKTVFAPPPSPSSGTHLLEAFPELREVLVKLAERLDSVRREREELERKLKELREEEARLEDLFRRLDVNPEEVAGSARQGSPGEAEGAKAG